MYVITPQYFLLIFLEKHFSFHFFLIKGIATWHDSVEFILLYV